MIDTDSVWKIFRSLLKRELRTPVMLLRLCEDNAGFICPAYSNRNTTVNSFPLQSHITAKEVADAKRGIASIFDLQSANEYTHLVQLKVRSNVSPYPIRTALSPPTLLHPGQKRSSQEPPDDPYMRPRKLSTCSTVYSLQASPSHVEQPRTPLSTVAHQESTYQLAETNEIDIEIALELVKEDEERTRRFDRSPTLCQPMEYHDQLSTERTRRFDKSPTLCQPMEYHDQLSINSRPRSATCPDSSRYMENNASIQRATDGFSQDFYIATPLIEKIFGKSEGDMTKPFIAIPQLEIDPRTGTAIPIDVCDQGRNNRRAMLGHDLHRDLEELSIVSIDRSVTSK